MKVTSSNSMRSNTRRGQLDHERYMRHREERKEKQKAYYRNNKDKYSYRHLADVYETKQAVSV